MVLPYVIDYNAVAAEKKYADIARTLNLAGERDAELVSALIAELLRLYKLLGTPTLKEVLGERLKDFMDKMDTLARDASLHPAVGVNPRPATAEEFKGMDIAYMKRTYGDRLCLMGNIDLAYTLTLGTPEEVVEETKQRLRKIAPGGGYCVSSSNSVTEYVPLENFNAMRETVLRYGRYPIRV